MQNVYFAQKLESKPLDILTGYAIIYSTVFRNKRVVLLLQY